MLRALQNREALFIITQNRKRSETRMDDDTEAETFQPLWVDWTERIISFHQEAGYERLEFSSNEEKMAYVFEKTSNGFRIQ